MFKLTFLPVQIQYITLRLRCQFGVGSQDSCAGLSIAPHPILIVEFHDAEIGNTIVSTLESPKVLLPMLRKKSTPFSSDLRTNSVYRIDRKTPAIELSLLNAGALFDIELPIVWNTVTGQVTESDTLWVYILT